MSEQDLKKIDTDIDKLIADNEKEYNEYILLKDKTDTKSVERFKELLSLHPFFKNSTYLADNKRNLYKTKFQMKRDARKGYQQQQQHEIEEKTKKN